MCCQQVRVRVCVRTTLVCIHRQMEFKYKASIQRSTYFIYCRIRTLVIHIRCIYYPILCLFGTHLHAVCCDCHHFIVFNVKSTMYIDCMRHTLSLSLSHSNCEMIDTQICFRSFSPKELFGSLTSHTQTPTLCLPFLLFRRFSPYNQCTKDLSKTLNAISFKHVLRQNRIHDEFGCVRCAQQLQIFVVCN